MKRKSSTPIDDDRLTPEEEKALAFSIVQSKAGLNYGPFEKDGPSLRAFLQRCQRTRRVNIRVPAILYEYLQTEAKRFGMRPGELMACILQIHQFKDRDRQLILLAVDHAASTKRKISKSKSKKS